MGFQLGSGLNLEKLNTIKVEPTIFEPRLKLFKFNLWMVLKKGLCKLCYCKYCKLQIKRTVNVLSTDPSLKELLGRFTSSVPMYHRNLCSNDSKNDKKNRDITYCSSDKDV